MSNRPSQPANGNGSSRAHRVIASLNRDQVDFLDKIGKDAQFTAGIKLSRTEILSALVNVLRRLDVTGEDIQGADQFERRILDIILRSRGGKPS